MAADAYSIKMSGLILFILATIFAGASPIENRRCLGVLLDSSYQAILSERADVDPAIWLPANLELATMIAQLNRPAGHGLTSHDFKGVLELGGLVPGRAKDSWGPEVTSISDLQKKDGLMASVGFANRNDYSSYSVRAEDYTGRDIIDRFSEVNPFIQSAGWKTPLFKLALRSVALRFAHDRPMRPGEYPIYLVFDIDGIETEYVRPEKVPSELRTSSQIPLEKLRYAMVPAKFVEAFAQSLIAANVTSVKIYPLELLELAEIEKNKSFVRSSMNRLTRPLARPIYNWISTKVR